MRTADAKRHVWVLAVLALSSAAAPQAAVADEAQWTLMVYMDADNDLESYGITDFLEMSSAGSRADVRVVVLFDRTPGQDEGYGNWLDTRRGLVRAGDVPDASWGESIGEANMGDPQTLIDFAEWGIRNFPARRYGLVLWDHGNGWWPVHGHPLPRTRGICWDDSNNGDALSVNEISSALETITASNGRLDLVGFDACLMGMVEVAYAIRSYGLVMVAAEGSEVGYGWSYESILPALISDPSMSAAELGRVIVDAYYEMVRHLDFGGENDVWTLSVVDLDQVEPVADGVASLAEALWEHWDSGPAVCAEAAVEVMRTIDAAVVYEKHWPAGPGSYGLAIYFPQTSDEFSTSYNESVIAFPGVTRWDRFLQDFQTSMGGSWVAQARDRSHECDADYASHIDLYDFCSNLAGAAAGDRDEDGIADSSDNCPAIANADQSDTDADGEGDACDTDDDGDGTPDVSDKCSSDSGKDDPGQCGCGQPDTDGDADGVADCVDDCPNDPDKTSPGGCGCGTSETDSDGDGVPDCVDDPQVAGSQQDPPGSISMACGSGIPGGVLLIALALSCLKAGGGRENRRECRVR